MDDSQKSDFAVIVTAMLETFGQEATRPRLMGYWLGLRDLSIDQVRDAVADRIARASRLPVPAELREFISGGNAQDIAMTAWQDVLSAVPYGPYKTIDFEDSLINAAIRNLGGWPNVLSRFSDAESEKWLRMEFMKCYSSLRSSRVNGKDACRPLPGIAQATCVAGQMKGPPVRRIRCDEKRATAANRIAAKRRETASIEGLPVATLKQVE